MLRYLLPDSSKVTPQVENTFKISNLLYPHSAVAGRNKIWQHVFIKQSDNFLTWPWLILSYTNSISHLIVHRDDGLVIVLYGPKGKKPPLLGPPTKCSPAGGPPDFFLCNMLFLLIIRLWFLQVWSQAILGSAGRGNSVCVPRVSNYCDSW